MIKTRFGEALQPPPNLVKVTAFETTSRPVRRVNDLTGYNKAQASLPAVALSAFKTRVREGDTKAVQEVWRRKDKTFLALDFEWSERNEKSVLEWGYAAVRCGYLDTQGQWPPDPDMNYRKGHFVVSEYADKVINKYCPNHPWDYAFGDSQVIGKKNTSRILEAVFTSLASPDSDSQSNDLVLVGHGIAGDLKKLEELKIKVPRNMLIIDTSLYERRLCQSGQRGKMLDPKNPNRPRPPNNTLSLETLLRSLPTTFSPSPTAPKPTRISTSAQKISSFPGCAMHNAGNDAFMTLFALQKLLEPEHTPLPSAKTRCLVGSKPSASGPHFTGLMAQQMQRPVSMVAAMPVDPLSMQRMSLSLPMLIPPRAVPYPAGCSGPGSAPLPMISPNGFPGNMNPHHRSSSQSPGPGMYAGSPSGQTGSSTPISGPSGEFGQQGYPFPNTSRHLQILGSSSLRPRLGESRSTGDVLQTTRSGHGRSRSRDQLTDELGRLPMTNGHGGGVEDHMPEQGRQRVMSANALMMTGSRGVSQTGSPVLLQGSGSRGASMIMDSGRRFSAGFR